MCRPIFGLGKAVVLESGLCVAKGITEIGAKGVYAVAQIKKRRYQPKGFPGDVIHTNFEDKEVGDVVIIEAMTEDNKLFKRFCMKYPDYVMKIMAIWVTLDKLEGASTRRDFIDRGGTNETKHFT